MIFPKIFLFVLIWAAILMIAISIIALLFFFIRDIKSKSVW